MSLSAAQQGQQDNFIRVGDLVTLKFLKHRTYLSAEGILVEDVCVSSSIRFFEEHLFQVYVQRQYSATNELEEFMTKDLKEEENTHMDALVRGKENESTLNRAVMKSKTGNVLYFGETIQLMHVKSGKFITVRPADLARDERENMKVTLSTDGSVMSWLKVMPRYKINREGEPITNNLEVVMKVAERSNEFLHGADRPPPRGKHTEVNSSLEAPTPWRLTLFQRVQDLDTALLLHGQLVCIRDPESQCVLAPITRPLQLDSDKRIKKENVVVLPGQNQFEPVWSESKRFRLMSESSKDAFLLNANGSHKGFNKGSSKFMESKNTKESDQDDGERLEEEDSESDHESVSSIDEFVLENGDVVFKPTTEADSDSLWVLESKNIVKGGPVRFRHEKVHFRHFNTGKYLSFHSQEDHPDAFRLRMNARPSEKGSTFNITQLHSAEENLLNGRAVQVKHAYFGLYLERGEHHSGQSVYPCEATRSKTRALSIILTRYAQAERKVLKAPTATEVWDVYFGHAVMHHVSKFVKATHIPQYSQSEVNTIWPKIDPADRGLFSLIVTRAALFVRGYPITAFNAVDTLSRMKPDKYAVAQRQDMLREQGLLRAMLNMLKLLKPISDSIISETAQASMVNRPRGYMDVGREVLAECLSLLYDLIKGNLGNQLYIADHLLVILAHVSTDKTAARVAQELLSSNRELQETKIGLREITIFADRMKEAPLNFMYLQLLQTCCSCLGEGLPKNQEIVHSVVFGSYKQEILVELREGGAGTWGATKGGGRIEESTKGCVDWGFGTSAYDLYIAPYAGKAQIRGEPLVFLLVPLYLTWKCGPLRNTPAKLFNVDLVPLWDLFRMHLPTSAKDKRRETIALQAMDSKRAVSEFFVAQLHLAAEMCLGRNYHVIHALEQLYSYEALVTILKSGGSNTESLKRAAAYLMLTLYVDRDPQSATPLPRLTRTLSEVRQSTGDELVRVEGARMYQFALLQGLISKHLMDVQQRSLGAHTYNMVQLLHSLVQFNFYGEVEKLKETISLLVACLRRDDSDLDHTQDSHILSSLMKLQPGGSAKRHSFKKPLTPSRSFADKDDKVEEEEGSMTPFPTTPFHTQALAYMEGPTANIGMVVFVLLSVAMALYYELTSVTPLYVLLDYAVYALFAAEFALHLFFHLMVHGTVAPFFCDPFNTMDLVALCAWVIVYTLRVSPFLKMVRLFRALRVPRLLELLQLHKLLGITPSALPDALFVWAEPERYQMTPESTVRTLVKVVQILCSVQGNIEDQQLSQVMQGYVNWASDPMSSSVEAQAIFREAGSSLCVSGDEVDDIYIDLLMYVHPSLVQATLELLVAHHSSRGVLLAHVQKLQLIDTEQGEEQYLRVVRLTTTLRRDADTHEIWGSLRTAEHRKINTDMYKFLNELTDYCRKRRDVLSFGEEFEPVVATQNILRNLGCFALCMKVVKLVVSIDKDDPFAEKHVNTRNLALLANKLLYWFVLDNPLNQTEAYSELQYLIKIVDAKVDAHKVIAGMFRNNLDLMETVPKKHIAEFVDLICTSGRFPQYLSLMSSILNVGEKNVIDNQYAIIKLIASPENAKKVVQFFCPVAAPAYQKKLQMMAPHLGAKDVSMDDLDSDLAYHLELMGLLSCCTVGRSGMTTIEAKVQSMYNFVDIVDAMLDPQALLLARIRSGLFLYNAMLDVETPLPALKDADCMWKLIISTQDVFMFAKDELRQIEKNGWDAPTSSRQKVEYVLVCAYCVHSYFKDYYDHSIFKHDVGQVALGVERVTIKEMQANDIIRSLFAKVSALYQMLSPLLAGEHHKLLHDTCVSLNNACNVRIVGQVDDIHEGFLRSAEDYSTHSVGLLKPFEAFRQCLEDESVASLVGDQVQGFIAKLEQVPSKHTQVESFVRFEPLVERLVMHIRDSIVLVKLGDETSKYITPATTDTDVWVLRILRTMVENRWGMTIDQRDDEGGEEQDDAVVELMQVYNEAGVTNMCLDLIAKGVDIKLQAQALKLLVAMLFKEGGALDIQRTIYAHLNKTGSEIFFRNVRSILQTLMAWHKWTGVIVIDGEPELPDEIIVVRCLQLMCEGHFAPNQDIFREQPNNTVSINLLDDLVLYLQALDSIKCRTSTAAELAVSATILEVIQGPCEGNQDYFALNTELIETLNRKIRQAPVNDCDETEEFELKRGAIDIFQALLEGQAGKTAVYERMLSVIHIDVVLVLCRGDSVEEEVGGEGESHESLALRTEALVLMQMLTDFRPSLRKELGLEEGVEGMGGATKVACIEVVWRGELQRRFFHVPGICHLLAKSTKDTFVAEVKRASPEDKLYGLLEASKDMYREIKHQDFLVRRKIDLVFSRTNAISASWLAFQVVLVINLLFVFFYHTVPTPCTEDDDASISYAGGERCTQITLGSYEVGVTIDVLNYVLIAAAFFVLLLYLVVRVPVYYQTYIEKDVGVMNAIILTALDPTTMYYFFYLLIAVVGLQYHAALTFLLLDFVTKSPTSQGVLRAVYNPRKQILMTLILTFIIIYIFAMYQFFFLNDGKDLADDGNGASLANNVKFLIHKGLPQGTAEDFMEGTISTFRIFYDLLFFVCILLVLNILKGITIDTFVELRKELEERLEDTTEKCFICGIDKNTFNRTLDRDAFEQHTKVDQNLWAYIYFIIYIWEQDKDDDDGLESFVRNCIENDDLFWFPMRKAIRLAEHQEKGDVHSLKYRFRRDLVGTESAVGSKMSSFKDQLSRTIGRVEKSIEYEPEAGTKARSRPRSIMGSVAGSQFQSQMQSQLQSQMSQSLQSRGGSPTASSDAPVSARLSLVIPQIQVGGQGGQYKDNASRSTAYEADKAGQMTVWVNSVVGMQASEAHLAHLQVRIKTAFDNHTYRPDGVKNHSVEQVEGYLVRQQSSDLEVKNVQARSPKHLKHTNSTFSSSFLSVAQLYREHEQRTGRLPLPTLMTFNEIENPRSLAHQGPLPTNALGNYVLRVQMVYAPPGLPAKFLGGVSVPVIELLNRAAIGQTLEVPFLPRPFDTTLPDQTLLTTSVESAGSFNSIEETPPVPVCYVSLTAAASRDLMDEWKALTAAV